ncbi:unnamed protein product, partial [Iphiclides podalirius]
MSLVAYDDSGSSEYEDDDQDKSHVPTNKSVEVGLKPEPSTSNSPVHDEYDTGIDGSLFNALPKPAHKASRVIEEEDEFLHKKEANIVKPKSKITVPSLSDFKDVADTVPSAKPRVVNGKKSGLLSILPQPKNGSMSLTKNSLIPHVLSQKSGVSSIKKSDHSQSHPKKPKIETKKLLKENSDDSDNEDVVENDFFSINQTVDIQDHLTSDTEVDTVQEIRPTTSKKEVRSIESYFKKDIENPEPSELAYTEQNNFETTSSAAGSENDLELPPANDVILDDEAILKLVGARGKRKMEEIQIVDFNQQEVLAEARELLLKGLMEDTSKRVSASKKRGDEPTHMQKRKHQITYLAHRAKANEIELQNKWANNRMSKRQSQSKYGF